MLRLTANCRKRSENRVKAETIDMSNSFCFAGKVSQEADGSGDLTAAYALLLSQASGSRVKIRTRRPRARRMISLPCARGARGRDHTDSTLTVRAAGRRDGAP